MEDDGGGTIPDPGDLPALEAAVETALRAARAASPAIQRSANQAAVRRAEALQRALSEAMDGIPTFVASEEGGKVLSHEFVEMVAERLPRACEFSRRAGVAEEWEDSLRQEVMQSVANSEGSQYVGPARAEEWPSLNGDSCQELLETFQLSRSGLVAYSVVASNEHGECGRLQGEGTWALQADADMSVVVLSMRQGFTGVVCRLSGGERKVQEPSKSLAVPLQRCRRVPVEGAAVVSEDEEDEDEEEEDDAG